MRVLLSEDWEQIARIYASKSILLSIAAFITPVIIGSIFFAGEWVYICMIAGSGILFFFLSLFYVHLCQKEEALWKKVDTLTEDFECLIREEMEEDFLPPSFWDQERDKYLNQRK